MLQDTLVLDLLYSEAGQSLLNILGTGVDTVDKLVSLGRYEEKMAPYHGFQRHRSEITVFVWESNRANNFFQN